MIKCIGYLKSLKQYLFILLISCFIFGVNSFVNSFVLSPIGGSLELPGNNICSINSQLQINCNKSSNVLASTFTPANSLNGFFWSDGGIGFLFNIGTGTTQKLINDGFFVCSGNMDLFMSGSYSASTICTPGLEKVNIGSYDSLINLFNGKTPRKWFHQQDTDGGISLGLIFDNFYFYLGGGGYNDYIMNGIGIDKDFGFSSGTGFGSVNFNNFNVYKSPFIYSGQGSSSTEINIGLTGDYLYSTCTNGEILSMLGNMGYNKYLCYGGLDSFDLWSSSGSYTPNPGTGKRLSQILSYSSAWDTPQDWFEYWNGLYQDKDNPLYYTMWESYPAVYRTWFDMYYNYNGPGKKFDDIREYCVMSVDLSLNPDSVYNGTQFKKICSAIIDIKQNPDSTYNQSGVAVGVNWQGVGNLSGENTNAVQFIQGIFNSIKSVINTNYDGPGFLPGYIILFLMALIFFRFISH